MTGDYKDGFGPEKGVKGSAYESEADDTGPHSVTEHSLRANSYNEADIEEVIQNISANSKSGRYSVPKSRMQSEEYEYTKGYEDRIQSIAEAIKLEMAGDAECRYAHPENEALGYSEDMTEDQELPLSVQNELKSLLNAAVKVGDVIRHFHDVANRTNLFALKVTNEAMKSEKGGKNLAVQIKDLAEETYMSAEKIYSCMYSIQQTIVSIADQRFEEYKHIPVDKAIFQQSAAEEDQAQTDALAAISPRTLTSLVEELEKLRNTSDVSHHYDELGSFADQLNAEINNLKAQLRTG